MIFFLNESFDYQKTLIAKTFCWHNNNEIIGFVSLLNDKIELNTYKKKKIFEISKQNYRFYPAVKIARLGINKSFKHNNLGSQILSFIKTFMVVRNKTGCRFLTVDAYNKPEVLKFYEKNDLKYLTSKDQKEKTRTMYYDLILDYNQIIENSEIYNRIQSYISTCIY